MDQFGKVEDFYKEWHPRLFDQHLVWKKLNDGATPRAHYFCMSTMLRTMC
jgi:hypothetical protein